MVQFLRGEKGNSSNEAMPIAQAPIFVSGNVSSFKFLSLSLFTKWEPQNRTAVQRILCKLTSAVTEFYTTTLPCFNQYNIDMIRSRKVGAFSNWPNVTQRHSPVVQLETWERMLSCIINAHLSKLRQSWGIGPERRVQMMALGKKYNWQGLLFLSLSSQLIRDFFSCPADSSIGDLVTDWLTEWVRDLLKNTPTEWPQRLVTFETFDQSDEGTWPDQKKDNDKDKDKYKYNDKDNPRELMTL